MKLQSIIPATPEAKGSTALGKGEVAFSVTIEELKILELAVALCRREFSGAPDDQRTLEQMISVFKRAIMELRTEEGICWNCGEAPMAK